MNGKSTFLIMFLFMLGFGLKAQTTHNVTISGFSFSPASLTIDVGDEVIWTNSTGTGHNVNGTTTTFPLNPESFGNSVGTTWTYSHTFTTEGAYTYQCDPHSGVGMSGQLTVNAVTTGIEEAEAGKLNVYPNPTEGFVSFDLGNISGDELSISLYNTLGERVKQVNVTDNENVSISTFDMSAGVYFYQLQDGDKLVDKGKLMVK